MPLVEHLSYSSISTYLLCPESWRRRYILKEKTPTALSLFFGSAVHNTIEAYLKRGGDLQALWRENYAQQLQFEDTEIEFGTETPESVSDDGLRILSTPAVLDVIEQIRSNYDPAREHSIERRIELSVPGVPVPIVGYIDIITRDGVPGDFKTAARMWAADKAAQEMQPLVYLAALNQAGDNSHGWRFRHYVITKTARPTAKVFECQRSPTEVLTGLFPTIQQVWQDINAGRFPKITTGWKCSSKYCDFWQSCQGGA